MRELTKCEDGAIKKLRRAFSALPATLQVYVVDDSVIVCARGIYSSIVSENVCNGVSAGEYLHELHDQLGAESAQ